MKNNKTNLLICILISCFVFQSIILANDTYLNIFTVTKDNLFSFVTSLSALFFHSGLNHLLSNTFIIFLIGNYLEDQHQEEDIFKIFLLGSIPNFIYVLLIDLENVSLLGASAGCYTLMGYTLLTTKNYLIRFILIWYIVGQMLALLFGDPDNVAHGVHILGAIAGLLYYQYKKSAN